MQPISSPVTPAHASPRCEAELRAATVGRPRVEPEPRSLSPLDILEADLRADRSTRFARWVRRQIVLYGVAAAGITSPYWVAAIISEVAR